jgi:hypothetical protein
MMSCDPTIGLLTQNQHLSSLHLSALLFSDSASRKTSRAIQSCQTSVRTPHKLVNNSSCSVSKDEISVSTYLNFVRNDGRPREPPRAKALDLYLQHCSSDKLSTFKIYKQNELQLDEDYCQQIHDSVSFQFGE